MWAGTSALRKIDQTLYTVRDEAMRLDGHLSELTNSLASNQRRRVMIIHQIASIRLSEIEKNKLQDNLTSTDKKVIETLKLRDLAVTQLNTQIDRLTQQLVEIEKQRQTLLDEVNAVSQKIATIESEVQSQLKNQKQYQDQFTKAAEADSIANQAEYKAEQAQNDMDAKAQPYRDDALFMYLWGKGYGTTQYNNKLLVRYLDTRVAKLIKYESARVNFWNLNEIPKRLKEHAQNVADIAHDTHSKLQQQEQLALEEAGIEQINAELSSATQKLDDCDDQLEQTEINLNNELEKRSKFSSGEDSYIQSCLATLKQALEHRGLESIHQYVLETDSLDDDALIVQLREINANVADVNDDLADIRTLHNKQLTRLKDLEKVRRRFKSARYDDARSGFHNKALVASVLSQFLQGVVSGADVWRVMQRNQRYRNIGANPEFGSGGLDTIADILGQASVGRRTRSTRRPSSWNSPRPRNTGRSSGGFKTGGGF